MTGSCMSPLPRYNGSTPTTKAAAKTVSGTRYYSAAGQTIAVGTATVGTAGTRLNLLAADRHGASSIATDAATQAVTKRCTTPFGAPRGNQPAAWPEDKSFLTGTGLEPGNGRPVDSGAPPVLPAPLDWGSSPGVSGPWSAVLPPLPVAPSSGEGIPDLP